MHRRHQPINIPTEIVRTVVTIAETGSFSKAGEKLGLSQPAISAQVKKLQMLIGGAVFDRASGGMALTERGTAILSYAKKLLDANDQILSLGGGLRDAVPLRVGLAHGYVESFFQVWTSRDYNGEMHFYCDQSSELEKALADGYLDVACLLNPPAEFCDPADIWQEEYIWVRSQNFVLSPGAPIPVVCWPGTAFDLPALAALERAGLTYRVIFTSMDFHARADAVAAGLGVMGIQLRQLRDPLMRAREYYLPPLRPVSAGICFRNGLDRRAAAGVLRALKTLQPAPSAATVRL
jgi:molybdate transport repressor ModE-like protein